MGFAEKLTDKDYVRLQIHEVINEGHVFLQSFVTGQYWHVTTEHVNLK
jgi:hypothetical protein